MALRPPVQYAESPGHLNVRYPGVARPFILEAGPKGETMIHDVPMKRRTFLGRAGLSAAGAAAGLVAARSAPAAGAARDARPNLLFILTDDQRWDAMGCAGHPFVRTPNMDRLAAEGVRFRNAFVTTSLCSPSRASFLTGRYAHAHGVFTNGSGDLAAGQVTFPVLLQKAGYETAFIGKWHMGGSNAPRPGFDHWVSFSGQGTYYNCPLNVDGQKRQAEGYITDELTDYAVAFLKKPRTRPFLLYLSHKAVHGPFTPPKRHADLYKDQDIRLHRHPDDRLDDKVPWGRKAPERNAEEEIRGYMAALTAVDEGLGRVLAALDEQKALDTTAIVFAGDNGYFHGEHGLWDKRAAYEPSMRIPLLVRYPPRAKAGATCDALVLNIDLAPTLLELAGLAPPEGVQGTSWLGVLAGTAPGRDAFLYEYFREGDARYDRPSVLAVRTDRWKVITYPSLPPEKRVVELYDLADDPHELRNLAGDKAHADTLRRMLALLDTLKEKTGYREPGRGY